jgi:hypothetical protein
MREKCADCLKSISPGTIVIGTIIYDNKTIDKVFRGKKINNHK